MCIACSGKRGEVLAKIRLVGALGHVQSRFMKALVNRKSTVTQAACASLAIACVIVAVTLMSPVSSRGADVADLLSGKRYPLSVKMGGLTNDWRRFTIHTTGNASGNIAVSVTGGGGTSGSSQNNIADLTGNKKYLTKGQTVRAEGRVYLVAYSLPGGGLDLPALIQALATKSPPAMTTLTAETTLPLSLLDVKSIGTLDDIQAFDLKREIAESEKLLQTVANALKNAGGEEKKATEPATPQDKSAK